MDDKHTKLQKLQATLLDRQGKLVPLPVAASVVAFELSGKVTAAGGVPLSRALDDSAHALSQIADIYYTNEKGHVVRIDSECLEGGRFREGAAVLHGPDGRVMRFLSIRRIDLMNAVEVLRLARGAVRVAENIARQADTPLEEGEK